MLTVTEKDIDNYYNNMSTDQQGEYYREVVAYGHNTLFHKLVVDYFNRNDKKKYWYQMITFTVDPKRHAITPAYLDNIERYIKKLLFNNDAHNEFVALVREGGDDIDKHEHWHCSLVTTKSYHSSSKLGYYRKKHGIARVDMSKVSNVINTLSYMSKQRMYTILKDSKNIKKFEDSSKKPNSATQNGHMLLV